MYPVSEEYLNIIMSDSAVVSWRGLITSKYGIPIAFTLADVVQGSGKITRQICTGEDLEIGTTCSSSLDISLFSYADRYMLYEASIQMWFQVQLANGRIEEIPAGTFYAVEPPERAVDILTFHAYDAMSKFEQPITANPQGDPYNILAYICDHCGVELGTTQEYIASCPNGLVSAYAFPDANLDTFRDMLGHLAAYLCCVAYVDVDNKLYLKRYGMETVRTIDADNRYDYVPMDYESYYSKLTAEFLITKETEAVTVDTNGLTYELGANAFLQIDDNDMRKQCMLAIINYLYGIRYTPFSATVPCDPALMVCDVLNFSGNHAREDYFSAITKQTITIGGAMELECTGRDPRMSLKTATQKAIAGVSYSKSDDTLHYYDFVNTDVIHIVANAKRMMLFNVDFVTTKSTHVDFHAQIAAQVENKEEIAEDFSYVTEYDGIVKITYALAGNEITDFYPVETFLDGLHVLNLLYSFWASGNQRSVFSVYIECIDCSLDIAVGHARGYMCGQGLVGDDAWDGTVHIYDEFVPRDFSMIRKEITDAVSYSKHNPVGGTLNQRITKWNASSILKTFTDALLGNDLIHYDVVYSQNIVRTSNAQIVDGSWMSLDSTQLGFVTTANENVNRILKVTSKHSGDDVAYIISFDGGDTWWTYANGWVEPDYTQDVYGMFEGTMRSITPSQWDEKLGDTGTIMIQAILVGAGSTLTDIQIYTAEYSDWLTISNTDVSNYNTRYVIIGSDRNVLNYVYDDYSGQSAAIDHGTVKALAVDETVFSSVNEITIIEV